jgi:hypothetical protein
LPGRCHEIGHDRSHAHRHAEEFREQARRPLRLVLPFFFITRAIARTRPDAQADRNAGRRRRAATMKEVDGASMVTIIVAFLAALRGVRSAQTADRRLVVTGFRPIEAVLRRLAAVLQPRPASCSRSRWPSPRSTSPPARVRVPSPGTCWSG